MAADKAPGSIYHVLVRTPDETYFAWSLASLAPWTHTVDPQPAASSRAALPLATIVAREGAKAPNKLCDVITGAHRNREAITQLKDDVVAGAAVREQRDTIGMMIRRWDDRDSHWRVQVLNAILVDAMDSVDSMDKSGGEQNVSYTHTSLQTLTRTPAEYPAVVAGWQQLLDHLADMDLMEAPSIKRLVDGKMLAKELGVKPGPWMGQALDVCLEWQLRNPDATDGGLAIDLVRQKAEELRIKGLK